MIASYVPARGWPRLAMALIGALAVIGLTDPRSVTSSPSVPTSLPVSSPVPFQAGGLPAISENTAPQMKGNDMTKTSLTNQLVVAATAGLLAVAA